MKSKAQTTRAKFSGWNYIKLKINNQQHEKTTYKMGKIFANYI